MNKPLTIGLFGFGVVGEGIYQVLQRTPSLNATIKKICIKHPDKMRQAPAELFTTNAGDILSDPEINVVVELINHAAEAYEIVSTALRKRKAVVSASKAMIAAHLPQLLALQRSYATPLLYEAAVCGSVPIIRNLEEYYDNELLESVCGIVNGSTNYILTRMTEEHKDYRSALLEAQQNGFAESDPSLDVEGADAANKLAIILCHAYGIVTKPDTLLYTGITQLHPGDNEYAAQRRLKIKLTAQARKLPDGKVAAFVLPQFVTPESQLYHVKMEYNGVVLQSSLADKQFLYGKGAGRYPTSSAVLSDISALRYDYRYEYRKEQRTGKNLLATDFFLHVYVSSERLPDIPLKDFEWFEEFHSKGQRQYLTGVISCKKLSSAAWTKLPGISLIVCPDGIIETIDHKAIREKSLTLAGLTLDDKTADAIRTFSAER